MKHFSFLLAAALFATTPAIAALATSEPQLPSDILAWEYKKITCTMYPGKLIVGEEYKRETKGTLRKIFIFSLNEKKIDQRDYSRTEDLRWSSRRYIKNTPGGNWLMFEGDDANGDESSNQMLSEIGITRDELASCNK